MKIISKIVILVSLLAVAQVASAASSGQACQALTRNLARGSSGQDVYQLQTLLIQEGLLHVPQQTYYFGNLTFGAVVAFQQKYNILATGFVGILTRGKLNILHSCQASLMIQYLQPNSGVIGSNVTIVGSGFTPTGNRVKFGNLGSENNPSYSVNSSNGTTITFAVPSGNYLPCWYSTPRCLVAMYLTQPGDYVVSVINANGTSNEVVFTVSSTVCAPNWQCGWGSCVNGYQSMTVVDANNCGVPYQNMSPMACPMLARACQ